MGVNLFLGGLTHDLYARCLRLVGLSTNEMSYEEIAVFSSHIRKKLGELQERITELQQSDLIRDERFWRDAYAEYQDIYSELALIEQFAMPVLIRYNDIDHMAGRLIAKLAHEIGFPQDLLPIATTTSHQYYWAKPELKIIAMPSGDVGGLLGWPDLIHELAHILLEAWPDFLHSFRPYIERYLYKQRQSLVDLNTSEKSNTWLLEARMNWGHQRAGMWQIEMAANLIATFVIGPSFGWQHIRLSINHSNDPFKPSPGDPLEDHPADQAQLEAIYEMLVLMGLENEGRELKSQWDTSVQTRHFERPQGYARYYPPELLKGIAQTVFDSCKSRGLIAFTENRGNPQPAVIVNLIAQGWQEFRTSSKNYPAWEAQVLKSLREQLLKSV